MCRKKMPHFGFAAACFSLSRKKRGKWRRRNEEEEVKLVGVDEYLNCEMEMLKCNRKVIERIGKKIKWERREGQY